MKVMLRLMLGAVLSSLIVFAEDSQRNVGDCRKACIKDFIPLIAKFRNDTAVYEELDNILKYSWTTCQYKCSRCALNRSIRVMRELSSMFYNPNEKFFFSFKYISYITRTIETDTNGCFERWDIANNNNDTSSVFL